MQAIALLLTIAAFGQPPYPDEPPALKDNEISYAIYVGGETWYVRALKGEIEHSDNSGYFWSDEPVPKFSRGQELTFEGIEEETDRNGRWRKQVEIVNAEAGFVRATNAEHDGYWVSTEIDEMSERARAAALQVIQDREALEQVAVETAPAETVEAEPAQGPGLLALWGPQAGVAGIALVLMGIVIRVFFVPDGTGWEKID